MKINRNTINSNVKFWYQELAKSFEADTIKGGIVKQLARYESQVNRLTEKLESCNDIEMQLNIEKLIADISNKASTLHLKILDNHTVHPIETKNQENEHAVDEGLVRHIVLFLALKYAKNPRLTEKSLKSEIINLENCTAQQAILGVTLAAVLATAFAGYAYAETVTSSVTIGTTCGIEFVPESSTISYGQILPGDTTSEQTFTVVNPGNVAAEIKVSGTDWLDDSDTNVMNADNTRYSVTTGDYSVKTGRFHNRLWFQ